MTITTTTVFWCIKMLLGHFTLQPGQPLASCLQLSDQNLKLSLITLLRLACLDLGSWISQTSNAIAIHFIVLCTACTLILACTLHLHAWSTWHRKCRCDDLYLSKLEENHTHLCIGAPERGLVTGKACRSQLDTKFSDNGSGTLAQ